MKLRMQFNSVRLRLKRGEVEKLAQTGRLEEKIILGAGPQDSFLYAIEVSAEVPEPQISLTNNSLLIMVPAAAIARWAAGSEVGMEGNGIISADVRVRILVEKDFACLDGSDEENADTFPHPLSGTQS